MAKQTQDPPIKFYDITIDASDVENDAMKLFDVLRPQWTRDKIKTKSYSEGFINKMMRFHLDGDEKKEDAIVVRVHGGGLDAIADREKEVMSMQLSHAAGCFPPVLAIFRNGVAYRYAPGRTLNAHDLNDLTVIRAVTKKLAQFHAVDPEKVPLVGKDGTIRTFDKTPTWEKLARDILKQYPTDLKDPEKNKIFQQEKVPKDVLSEFINEYLPQLISLDHPKTLNHCDFHVRNMILDERKGDVIFVDYEISDYRDDVYDLFYLLTSRVMYTPFGIYKPEDPPISPESRELWLRSYIQAKWSIMGRDPDSIPDVIYDRYLSLLEAFEIFGNAIYVCFGGAYAEIPGFPVNSLTMLPVAAKRWRERNDDLQGIIERFRDLDRKCQGLL